MKVARPSGRLCKATTIAVIKPALLTLPIEITAFSSSLQSVESICCSFAPSCLEEDVEKFFDIRQGKKSPYMLLTQPISDSIKTELTEEEKNYKGIEKLKAYRSTLPAITHVNYSARIQTVSKKVNERYWNIINEFKKLTDCSVVVNTSFNIRGEPIVNTPENAYKCFMFTDLDVLVLENFVLLKEEQKKIEGIEEYQKQFKLD